MILMLLLVFLQIHSQASLGDVESIASLAVLPMNTLLAVLLWKNTIHLSRMDGRLEAYLEKVERLLEQRRRY